MTDRTIEQTRGALRSLLAQYDDPPMTSIEWLNDEERYFMITTCCAEIIVHTLLEITLGDRMEAHVGLTKLMRSMERRLGQ